MEKKQDLSIYYKLAEEAFQDNNVEEALKISRDGLKHAKQLQNDDWVKKFDLFNTNVSELQTLVPSIRKESLTLISGIGPKSAERLIAHGIDSISELANSTPTRLSKIEGIGLSTAQKYVNRAKEHLRLKKLNAFSKPVKAPEKLKTIQEPPKEEIGNFDYSKIESNKKTEGDNEIKDEISSNDELGDFNNIAEEYLDFNKTIIKGTREMHDSSSATKNLVIYPEVVRQSTLTLQEKQNETNEL
ncbi:MAG: helix-hairpin-helix domain-containing protein, partial [Candidatus Thorarchaeota archaeon]